MAWEPWLGPFLAWLVFMMTLYFVMVCMLVLLRKQWVENEKLAFPLTILPLEMTRPAFFKQGLEKGAGLAVSPKGKLATVWAEMKTQD